MSGNRSLRETFRQIQNGTYVPLSESNLAVNYDRIYIWFFFLSNKVTRKRTKFKYLNSKHFPFFRIVQTAVENWILFSSNSLILHKFCYDDNSHSVTAITHIIIAIICYTAINQNSILNDDVTTYGIYFYYSWNSQKHM